MSFKYSIHYSQFTFNWKQTLDVLMLRCLSFFLHKNADHTSPNDPQCFQLSESHLANGILQSRHPSKIV